ncbi:hypothetical protein QVD17_32789 [Tagetes erecta]|uniref:FBD domain-containing protein n=1 Tax=Tagetes erecta TaxID=13708 RepID=A0AAD8JY48_TARER|nr:hypothetical protein QVD17_32789 [Tagetes erecta]
MFSDDIRDIGDSTVTNLFESFSMVEDLSIWLSTIMCFVQDVVPRVLPTPLIHLKYLYVGHMNFAFKDGLPILLFLIRSSPNLEKLQIQIFDDLWVTESRERPSTLESLECYSDIWLERLNVLEISYFSNEKMELDLELDFMTFILAKSPVLKKVKICLWRDINEDDELHISRTLLSSQRASPMTEIIVERDNFDYGAV